MGILQVIQAKLFGSFAGGELRALRQLFTPAFRRSLEASEQQSAGNNPRLQIATSLAWIDKIPLARFAQTQKDFNDNVIDAGVELGDLMIVRTTALAANGKLMLRESRSAIVQAKVAKKPTAVVPVGPTSTTRATSSSKELKLLEEWPKFHLYQTSASKKPELRNVNVDANLPHSFFWAFWKGRGWAAAKAKRGVTCNEKLDTFFENLRSHTYGADCHDTSEWARLTHAVLEIAQSRTLPTSLGANDARVQTSVVSRAGFSFPFPERPKMALLFIDVLFWEDGTPGDVSLLQVGNPWTTSDDIEEIPNQGLAEAMLRRLRYPRH